MSTVTDLSIIYIFNAIIERAANLEKTEIPNADRLSKSEDQSLDTREYFKRHTDDIKNSVREMRAFARDLMRVESKP